MADPMLLDNNHKDVLKFVTYPSWKVLAWKRPHSNDVPVGPGSPFQDLNN